jgi:hypothetical protein
MFLLGKVSSVLEGNYLLINFFKSVEYLGRPVPGHADNTLYIGHSWNKTSITFYVKSDNHEGPFKFSSSPKTLCSEKAYFTMQDLP